MTSDRWWESNDPAVFGPVAVEVKVGEIPRHQGDFLYAMWEGESPLLLLDRDGRTIEIDRGYVIQVERPQGSHAGKVLLDQMWQKGAMSRTRGPATPGSD